MRVPGASVQEQAIRIAGAMAELGVKDLVLKRIGACTGLLTRHTDLPGILASMPPGSRLECASLGVVIEPTDSGLVWRAIEGGCQADFERAMVS